MIIGISAANRHFVQGRWLAGFVFLVWSVIVSTAVFIAVKKYDPEH